MEMITHTVEVGRRRLPGRTTVPLSIVASRRAGGSPWPSRWQAPDPFARTSNLYSMPFVRPSTGCVVVLALLLSMS